MSRLRAGALIAILLAFAVVLVLVQLRWSPLHQLDVDTADDLNARLRTDPGAVTFWQDVSDVLHPNVLRAAAAAAAVVLWLRARRDAAVFVAVTMAGAAAVEAVGKAAVGRARPAFAHAVSHAAGASFPSGHATTSFVAFGLLALLVPRRAKLPAALVAVAAVALVGFSRVALGVHYVSDVLGGWLLGAAVLVAGEAWLSRR